MFPKHNAALFGGAERELWLGVSFCGAPALAALLPLRAVERVPEIYVFHQDGAFDSALELTHVSEEILAEKVYGRGRCTRHRDCAR